MGWPADRKEAVLRLVKAYAQSERRCCRVLRLNRGLYRRQPKKDEQAFLRMRIKEIAAVRVRYGYRRIHVLLRREGWAINVKRVYRLYKIEGLNLRNHTRRREPIKTELSRTARQRRPMNAGPWISSPINCMMASASGC